MQLPNMYIDYLRERENAEVLQSEHAFYVFTQIEPGIVYIKDMYVMPEYRRTGEAGKLFKKLVELLRERNVVKLIGSTATNAANPELGAQAMFSVGFKITGTSENTIWYAKEIV